MAKLKADTKKLKARPKVFVGLSGGVDSAVSAALLQKAGFLVTGVFIKAWSPEFLECTWREDRRDAIRVAAHLDIPFITLDLQKEYKKEVVDYMIREYKKGRTPNPDVMCNKEIKFGAFYDFALSKGADFVATGHYVRKHERGKDSFLVEGRDKAKDQSYFLWTLKKEQLRKVLFPVGDLPKPKVRALAKSLKLPNALKKDSQGLCFLGKVDMKDFLTHFIANCPGAVLDESGKRIGTHTGAAFLTIGQRHGFMTKNKKTGSRPHYVQSKDMKKNTVVVSEAKPDDRLSGSVEFSLRDTNWVANPLPHKEYRIRLRYHQKPLLGTVIQKKSGWRIVLREPFLASPGQSAVIYDGEILVGGGVIEGGL